MIDGSEKCNRQLAFELRNSHVCEKRSKSMSLNLELVLYFYNRYIHVCAMYMYYFGDRFTFS